ncbi:hypothetical protein GCM10022393_08900 [Aquimarina addita]|uniref:DUF4199 domain-containing protein n=1 Tax=Aquimarina addita TaxID=870485 RepID=A0ABP7XC73_9FLAO
MKNIIFKYGSFAAITICILFFLGLLGENLSYSIREVIGYSSMIVSLLFIFFGIKQYRDKENKGILTLNKALLIGIFISLIAATAFGIIDMIYITYINPDFMTEYYTHAVEQMRLSLSETEFKVQLMELEKQKELFMNPFFNFLVMFVTVMMIGCIISLISGFILQRKPTTYN